MLRDHMIKETWNLVSGSLKPYVTILLSLMLIGFVEVDIKRFYFWHMTSRDQMTKMIRNLLISAPQTTSPPWQVGSLQVLWKLRYK